MRWLWVGVAATVLAGPAIGLGQTFEGDQGFAVERHRMTFDDEGILSVEGAEVGQHLGWNIGLWLGAADDPLVLNRLEADGSDTRIGDLVAERIGGSLIASLGLYDWFQIGLEAPVIIYQQRPDTIEGVTAPLPSLQTFGFGAPRLAVKVRILREKELGLALALIPAVTLPASSLGSYLGDNVVVFTPDVALAKRVGPVRFVGNVGYRAKSTGRLLNISINDELLGRFAAGIRLEDLDLPPIGIDLGVSVATSINKIFTRDVQDHVELLSGLRYDFDGPWLAFAGAGIGLQRGYGTPDWRVFAGLRVTGILERDHRPQDVRPVIVPTVCCRVSASQPAFPDIAEAPVLPPAPHESQEVQRPFIQTRKVQLSTIVYFATDSAMLNRVGVEELATFVAEVYSAGQPLKVEIIGHTDSRHNKKYNLALSMGRSQAVRRELIRFGIPMEVIQTFGRGLGEPAAPNSTTSGRRMNRRAEVRAIIEQPIRASETLSAASPEQTQPAREEDRAPSKTPVRPEP